ncbi:MAG TPA: hypothetical protein VGF50_13085 [Caulobacteraceae bacterium]|jgi:hypothetical protein
MRPLIPALGASALVAAAIVWAPLPGAQDPAPAVGDPARPAAAPAAATPAAAPAMAYVRFAPDAAAAAAAAAAPKPTPPALVGLAGAGRARTAYIMADGAPVRARVGDKVGRWRLAAVGPHSVTLTAGGKTMSLAFFGPRPTPPPPPPSVLEPSAPASDAQPAAQPAAPPPVREHAVEPASAPPPYASPRAGPRPCYWVGPAATAPKGCIALKPGQLPPR